MAQKNLFFKALFLSGVFVINIPAACPAQSADNTGINKENQAQNELTAEQQGETKEDIQTTQDIRRVIVKDKSLSTYAHNVKIITIGGMVTLKGPVKSEEEKMTVETIAAQIAGNAKITSEIEIAPQ